MDQKIIISGSFGMLGSAFKLMLTDCYAYNKKEFNILNYDQMEDIIVKIQPEILINCAAFTDVDGSESDPIKAFEVNTQGILNLVKLAKQYNFRIINFSTDYVFPGNGPYNIEDNINPLNAYGGSKVSGEQILRWCHPKSTTIRTSWLFGPYGSNFVSTMLELFKSKEVLKVINDQIGVPTYTFDLVEYVVENLLNKNKWMQYYHITNSGQTSWYKFARKIAEYSQSEIELQPVSSSEYDQLAKRPHNSILLNNHNLRNWEEGLKDYMQNHLRV